MKLTSLSQYHICKLLRRYSDKLKCRKSNDPSGTKVLIENLQSDLIQSLASIYPQEGTITTVVQELENLVMMHQYLENRNNHANELIQVEQRLFQLLNLELLSNSGSSKVRNSIPQNSIFRSTELLV